jgi:hypothetical protein
MSSDNSSGSTKRSSNREANFRVKISIIFDFRFALLASFRQRNLSFKQIGQPPRKGLNYQKFE